MKKLIFCSLSLLLLTSCNFFSSTEESGSIGNGFDVDYIDVTVDNSFTSLLPSFVTIVTNENNISGGIVYRSGKINNKKYAYGFTVEKIKVASFSAIDASNSVYSLEILGYHSVYNVTFFRFLSEINYPTLSFATNKLKIGEKVTTISANVTSRHIPTSYYESFITSSEEQMTRLDVDYFGYGVDIGYARELFGSVIFNKSGQIAGVISGTESNLLEDQSKHTFAQSLLHLDKFVSRLEVDSQFTNTSFGISINELSEIPLDQKEAAFITSSGLESYLINEYCGFFVVSVARGGVADKNGILPGDIIIDINDIAGGKVLRGASMRGEIAVLEKGKQFTILIRRPEAFGVNPTVYQTIKINGVV